MSAKRKQKQPPPPAAPVVALVMRREEAWAREIIAGIATYARAATGWHLQIMTEQAMLAELRRKRHTLVGAIGDFAADRRRLCSAVTRRRLPTVNIANRRLPPKIPSVVGSEAEIGRLAAQHLLDRGLQRFAFLGVKNTQFSDDRCDGFRRRLSEQGVRPARLDVGRVTDRGFRKWAATLTFPVGLLACSDGLARDVSAVCDRLGIAIPRDIALVGVDNDVLECELATVPITSVAPAFRRTGYVAAQVLNALLLKERPPARVLHVPPVGIEVRQSTDVLAVDDEIVRMVLGIVRDHACDPLRVRDIVRQVPLSRRPLELRFRRATGHTIHDEIRRVQLERARRLLLETNLGIKEIVAQCGHSDANRFAQHFRKAFGHPPARFRRMRR